MFLRLLFLIIRFSTAIDDKVDLLLTKNENYPLMAQSIVIPLDHFPYTSEEIFQSSTFKQSIQSISQSFVELKKVYNIQENFLKIFKLESTNQEEVKICYSYPKEIICDQTFKNYLLNNQLIELNRNSLNFYTNSSDCLTVFEISLNIYLLECNDIQGKQLKLINQNSLIINQLLIPTKFNQSMHVIQQNQTYIIYEVYKDKCYFTFVEINNHFNLEVVKLYFFNENVISEGMNGDIVLVTSQRKNTLSILFNQFALEMDTTYFNISKPFKLNDNKRQLFRSIMKQKTLQFIIDKTQQQEIQQKQRRVIINPKNDQLRNAFIISQNYILYFGRKIFISNNNAINYTITQEFQELLDLGSIPILFGITKAGQIQIYQIFDLPQCINLNSSKVLFVININQFNFEMQKIYTLEENKSEKPELVPYIQENIIFILLDINFCWNDEQQQNYLEDIAQIKISDYLYGSIWQIVGFKDFDQIVDNLDQFKILKYQRKQSSPLLLIYLENSAIYFEFYQNKTVIIQYTLQQKYQLQNYNFNIDNCQVFTSTFDSDVIIVDKRNKKIVIYQYMDSEIKVKQFKLKSTINSIFQQDDFLSISLENCTQIHIQMKTLEMSQTIQTLQQNCTYYNSLNQRTIFYSQNLIQISWITKEVFSFQNIIEFQKLSPDFYILFQLIENQVQSQIYCLAFNKLIYLKKLITHEYQIHYPIQYKTYSFQFLALLAFKITQNNIENNKDYFVLIYDYWKPQSSQLLKVIPIDDSHSQFSFIGKNRFITIYKKDVLIQNLLGVYVSIKKMSLSSDTYIKTSPLELKIKSQISEQQILLTIKYKFVNNNQILSKKLENQNNYFIFSDNRKSKIIDISNIFGNIDSIFYNNKAKMIPLQSTEIVDIVKCIQYITDICLKDEKSLIINSFSDSYHFNIENLTIFYLIKYENFNNGSYLYYLDNDYYLKKLILNEQRVIIYQQNLYDLYSESFRDLYIIGQILLIYNMKLSASVFQIKNQKIEKFLINNKNEYDNIKIIFKSQKYYMMTYNFHFVQSTIIIAVADDHLNITCQKIFSLKDILDQDWIVLKYQSIKDIEIIDCIDGNTEIKYNFLLCFELLQCYRILLTLNKVDQSFFTKVQNVIRYGNKKQLQKLELLNSQYLILQLQNQQNNRFFQFFKLNQDIFIIDSYSTIYHEQTIHKFHIYNQTHFIENTQYYLEHNLRKFVDYQIQCNDICDNDEIIITLQNNVSSINLTFVSESNFQSQKNLQIIIISINALLIILFNQRKQKFLKQIQNKQKVIIANK